MGTTIRASLVYLANPHACRWVGGRPVGAAPEYASPVPVEVDVGDETAIERVLERIHSAFHRHNGADQHEALDRLGMRSLRVGDVVIVDGRAYRVAPVGFDSV